MKPTVIDLFAGVGGLSLGFEHEGFEIVLANEYDESIATAYKVNHPKTNMIVGDITSLDLNKVFYPYKGKVDVVIGGPPCQGFSQKGQRKTIHDKRNFLFKYYVEVVRLVEPKYFVMENVPNLLTAEDGYFKGEIVELFNSMGYTLNSGVLNAADYGVPQNRRRAVIIGKKNGTPPLLPLISGKEISEEKYEELVNFVGLKDIQDICSGGENLSGGQRKKLLIIKFLLRYTDASFIVLDEIQAGLDKSTAEKFVKLLNDLDFSKKTVIVIEHSNKDKFTKAKKILLDNMR